MNVFLGGTCNGSTWREQLIPTLEIDYFNPMVHNWDEQSYEREKTARQMADFCLFVITPRLEGFFSLAEVVDTAYKRTDRTIYCFLLEDEGRTFSEQQLQVLNQIGRLIEDNGSLWLHSLAQISEFFKAATQVKPPSADRDTYDVFISYGRRHSKDFAIKLRQALVAQGYEVWFDKENIAIAVDFQQKIDEGIRASAHFCYILSPHSVHSEYCDKELFKALELNKRIIPVYHTDMGSSSKDIHEQIQRRNWMQFENPALFNTMVNQMIAVIEQDREVVYPHCDLLTQATGWRKGLKQPNLLLYGKQISQAKQWLKTAVERTDLEIVPLPEHTSYINESAYFSSDGEAEVFILYHPNLRPIKRSLEHRLILAGFSFGSELLDPSNQGTLGGLVTQKLRKAVSIVVLAHSDYGTMDGWKNTQQFIKDEDKRTVTVLENQAPAKGSDLGIVLRYDPDQDHQVLADSLIDLLKTDSEYLLLRNRYYCRAMQWHEHQTDAILLSEHELKDYADFATVALNKSSFPLPQALAEFALKSENHLADPSSDQDIDVFLSCDIEDLNFVRRLARRLREFDKKVFYQRQDNPDDAQLSEVIEQQLNNAKVMILVLPRDISHKAELELAQATRMGKQVVPLKLKRFAAAQYPQCYDPYLSDAVMVDELLEFTLADVLNALSSDDEYLKSHRHWLKKMTIWQDNNCLDEFLLGQKESIFATAWLEEARDNRREPAPTQAQQNFIDSSREHIEHLEVIELKRQRHLKAYAVFSSFLCILSFALYLYAAEQHQAAEDNFHSAQHNAEKARQNAVTAQNNALRAERNAQSAKQNELKAQQNAQVAQQNETKAQKHAEIARQNQLKAQQHAEAAKRNAHRAKLNEQKAIKSRLEAERLKEIAQAQTKIYQARLSQNPQEQFHMAKQAYQVLKQNQANTQHNILFNILYRQLKTSLKPLNGHQSLVKFVGFNHGTLISIDQQNRLIKWQVDSHTQIKPSAEYQLAFEIRQAYLDKAQSRLYLLDFSGALYHLPLSDIAQLHQHNEISPSINKIVHIDGEQLWLQGNEKIYQLDLQSEQLRPLALTLTPDHRVFVDSRLNQVFIDDGQNFNIWQKNLDSNHFEQIWQQQQNERITHVFSSVSQQRLILADQQGLFYYYQWHQGKPVHVRNIRAHSHQLVGGVESQALNHTITASLDGTVKLWQVGQQYDNTHFIELEHSQWIHSITNAQIGDYEFIFVGTESGEITLFPADVDFLIEHGQQQLVADLKPAQTPTREKE